MLNDLRLAIRGLLRRPGFTLVAGLAFALGIGATTAIFTLIEGVLLRPLGYRDEARLYAVTASNPSQKVEGRGNYLPDFWFFRENVRSFEDIGFYGWRSMTLEEPGNVQQIRSVVLSANLFRMLGVEPILGRQLAPEDEVPGRGSRALIGEGLWDRLFGSDPSILGKTIRIDGASIEIVGVMPREASVPSAQAELWLPVGYLEAYAESEFGREERDFVVVGRLAEGVSHAQATADLKNLNDRLEESFPATNAGWDVELLPFRELVVGNAELPLWLSFAAVAAVLLIACANIANLVLVRGLGRERELSVRRALGAGSGRIVRQQVVESLVLTFSGGGAGIALAYGLTRLILVLEPGVLPRKEGIGLGLTAALFALAVSTVTGIVFGSISALSRREGFGDALGGSAGRIGARSSARRASMVFVSGQLALALALLVAAGSLLNTLGRLSRVDPGFEPGGLFSSHIILDQVRYRESESRRRYFKRLVEEVRAIPGVTHASLSTTPPVRGLGILMEVPYRGLEGPLVEEREAPRAWFRVLAPGYFETLRTPLQRGRDFTEQDDEDAPLVAIVNQTLARNAFADQDPVGRRLQILVFGESLDLEVVGVSADTRFLGLHQKAGPEVFLPHAQMPFLGMGVVARTTLAPAAYREALERAVLSLDPLQPLMRVATLEEALHDTLAMERFSSALLGIFSCIAVVLAACGVYGIFSYWVSERRREIGLRMALGASVRDVEGSILKRGLGMVLPGLAAGILAAAFLGRALRAAFETVAPTDPVLLISASVGLALVAMAACFVPARQAARIDPTLALRSDP
jgi:putative ABC transport system permease protein